jgi:hypothetical protein
LERKDGRRFVVAGSRINGEVKLAISPEILKKAEGLPWHARVARIAAITGRPFVEVRKALSRIDEKVDAAPHCNKEHGQRGPARREMLN